MLKRENFIGQDVYEYAAWLGAWDSANNRYNENVFSVKNAVAAECRRIYELAHDLEKESNVLWSTALHETLAFIREWNDLKGYGTVEYVANGAVAQIWFSYNNLEDPEQELVEGSLARVVYKINSKGEKEALTVAPHETIKHKVWKAETGV